jgi:3-oxoacyl-[acyl-carrier protein] reductase
MRAHPAGPAQLAVRPESIRVLPAGERGPARPHPARRLPRPDARIRGRDRGGHVAVRRALDGAFLLSRAIAPQMAARGGGSIIALSGISTHVGTPNRAHVSASKAGLEGLMRALAVELAPQGIRANCVAPGAVDTQRGASAGPMPNTLGREAGIPLGRKASVDEIAAVVRMLAGPEGGYVTGQTIHVNGGAFLT